MNISDDEPLHIFRFRISLDYVDPEVWRLIEVPSDYDFWKLHVAIQDAMGWLDYHLHQFMPQDYDWESEVKPIGIPDDNLELDFRAGWETLMTDEFLRPGDTMDYEYDFGDGWRHSITLEEIRPMGDDNEDDYPKCVGGENACPPEDCGGPPGYQDLLEILRNPKHPEYREYQSWLKGHPGTKRFPFDPKWFDPKEVIFDDPYERFEEAFGPPSESSRQAMSLDEGSSGPMSLEEGSPGASSQDEGSPGPMSLDERARHPLCGLSRQDFTRLIQDPFGCPDIAQFSDRLTLEPDDVPVIMLLDDLRKAIENGPGLKATQTGALPVWFVKQTAAKWYEMEHHPSIHDIHKPGREETFHELHCTKTLLKAAGMLRLYRGKFILSRECRDLIEVDDGGYRAVWPVLFQRTATTFNLSYWDGFPYGGEMQRAWPFVMFTLSAFGFTSKVAPLYWALFCNAFPSAYENSDQAMFCFRSRILERFFELFGLIRIQYENFEIEGSRIPHREAFITATPLLHDAAWFHDLDSDMP